MASPLRFLVILALMFAAAAPAAAQVGVASVTVGQPRGTPPAQAERVLRVGIDVFANERIVTGAADRAHLVFLDGSALTVGPNAELTIDRFVYDPATRTGELSINASRGAMRFVGGAISKKSEVTLKTPSAVIGIRGGIFSVVIGSDGSVMASFFFGNSMTATNQFGQSIAIRAGSVITVPYGGPPLSPVMLANAKAMMDAFEALLGGPVGIQIDDKALLDLLMMLLNTNTQIDWVQVLQTLATQGILVRNANTPTGAVPPMTPPGDGGGGGGGGGD